MISNMAAQHVRSPLTVLTANVELEDRRLVADFCPSACYTYPVTVERFTYKHSALCLAARALCGRGRRRDIHPMELQTPSSSHPSMLSRLLDPVGRCLTPEVAQHLVALQVDPAVQA